MSRPPREGRACRVHRRFRSRQARPSHPPRPVATSATLPLGHPSTTLQSITTLRSSFARQAALFNSSAVGWLTSHIPDSNFVTAGFKITFGALSNLAASGRQISRATGWQIAIGLADCGRDALPRVRHARESHACRGRSSWSRREGHACRGLIIRSRQARPSRMLSFFTYLVLPLTTL